ncbi:DUF1015 domain-containing protein [Marinoscillum furvescens]|uniref:Uncharacterized protein (DUF1015 family) n=1 Tax=Marinoscillum furvescens DSM 4134 TaxID=1122208 RepID=A0A3D9KYB2_MARFU|nr:DUF1015 domain-containing protein [Marinoscillum furvescens]RED94398.1 uncharacterized protein (DUF1015 family) [Marinoscillum furvescens DSM 4134]
MAEIRPIAGWRYHRRLTSQIDNLTSPLFDVVSDKQREALYQNPLNSIHLSVPRGKQPAKAARETLENWKSTGVLVQDQVPALYVYYQYFSLRGSDKTFCRKGFIANLRVYDWPEKVLLRHESTMPYSVSDRTSLLEQTQLNVSPTHGLYTDPSHEIEKYLDESMRHPLYESEDYQGVRDVFSVIQDRAVIQRIQEILRYKQIILADGHHRYEGSLNYMKAQQAANPQHTGEEGYNFHMMYFTNTEAEDLRILPTHRVVSEAANFSEKWLLEQLEAYFTITPVENAPDVNEVILGKQWAFGLLVGDNAYKIRLKPECLQQITWNFPQSIKEMDLTVMHYFIFEKILGIPGPKQVDARNITFQRNFTECMREVLKGEAQFAVITNDISIETVKKVCYSGYTMPQKSTYFYPKVISGFVFSSIADEEFRTPFDPGFQQPSQTTAPS